MHWPWRVCEIIFTLIPILKLVSPRVCETSLLYYYKLKAKNWRIMHCNWRLAIFDTWFKLKFLLLRFEASRGVRGRGDKTKSQRQGHFKDNFNINIMLIVTLSLSSSLTLYSSWFLISSLVFTKLRPSSSSFGLESTMHHLWMRLFWPLWDEPKPNQTLRWDFF